MEFDQFELEDPKRFFEGLVKRALAGKRSEFEFIRDVGMRQTAKLYKRGTKKISKMFGSLARGLIEQYSRQIGQDEQSVEALLAAKQFEICRDFYAEEFRLAKDMLAEYRAYVMGGHILDTLFGKIRTDDECVDYRKLPWKLF